MEFLNYGPIFEHESFFNIFIVILFPKLLGLHVILSRIVQYIWYTAKGSLIALSA